VAIQRRERTGVDKSVAGGFLLGILGTKFTKKGQSLQRRALGAFLLIPFGFLRGSGWNGGLILLPRAGLADVTEKNLARNCWCTVLMYYANNWEWPRDLIWERDGVFMFYVMEGRGVSQFGREIPRGGKHEVKCMQHEAGTGFQGTVDILEFLMGTINPRTLRYVYEWLIAICANNQFLLYL
jgi:hypothetical protein